MVDRIPPRRVVGRLDIKGQNVIKGVHLEGLRVVGNPGEFARTYYEDGIDELVYMDTVASLYGRNNLLPVVEQAAREVFVPLTVGGGMRTLDDITAALRSGADKVAINTAAIQRPDFIREAAEAFGSQCVVVSIEAKLRGPGRWEALVDNGRERTGVDVIEWVKRTQALGAGEFLITSVDREGTQKGFDHDLFSAVRAAATIPVVGCGGAGSAEDVASAFSKDDLDGVACASIFHYRKLGVKDLKTALSESNVSVRV